MHTRFPRRYTRTPGPALFGLLGGVLLVATTTGCRESEPAGELPVLVYTAPVNAYVGQTVVFDASESFSPDNEISWFGFDYGDGAASSRGTDPVVYHAYDAPGRYRTKITLVDGRGNKYTEVRDISIVEPGEVSFLFCQQSRPFCAPFFVCNPESLRCDPDVDGDGIAAQQDPDEPACLMDEECPTVLVCLDGLCRSVPGSEEPGEPVVEPVEEPTAEPVSEPEDLPEPDAP